MDETINDFNELVQYLDIKLIDNSTKFWMIRTKEGFFYDEFIDNSFIALGWNVVLEKDIIDIMNSFDNKEMKAKKQQLQKLLKEKYPKNKRSPLNKCIRFINEIKNGDIIMIPSSQNEKISFAMAGEYYEEKECTYEKEIETIDRIDDGEYYGMQIKCPYKKRRKITVLKTINGSKMNINLYKVLASYHGLNEINDYADFILSSIYPVYYWNGKLNMAFDVETKKDIDAFYLSSFMYHVSNTFKFFDNDIRLVTKVNLNCPGQLLLSFLVKHSGDLNQLLISYKTPIIFIWASIVGGKFGKITIQTILDYILKFREQNSKLKSEKIDRDFKKKEIEEKTFDIELKKEEIKGKKIETEKQSIELKQLNESYSHMNEAASDLEINKASVKNIIDFSSYCHPKNDD